MKNLPKIVFALVVAASLYACNKKDERELFGGVSERSQRDSLHHHDTLSNDPFTNDPLDTTYNGNEPYDTIYNGNEPYDTTYHGGNDPEGIDSALTVGDSLGYHQY